MAGDSHAEIPENGAVFTFGRSRFANNAASHFFIRNDPVAEVSCGDEHTAVVCQNGRVFVFGSNSWGQLGLGHKNTATMPSCVKSLKPEKATHVACGKSHTIVSTFSGKVLSFGCNMDCQLGLGDTEERLVPVQVDGIPVGEDGIRMLSAGCQHSAALTAGGGVYVWGSNADGQIGLGDLVTVVDKATHLDLPGVITYISCGYYHTAFVTEEGKLLMCGEGENGKLGISRENRNVYVPTPVNVNAPIRFAACGGNHTIAITMEGDVYGFGSNLSGQLGLGREVLMYSVPEAVETLLGKHVCAAACGESHTAFLTVDGHMYVCGDGRHGKLCVDTDDDVDGAVLCTPQFVTRFSQYRVKQVACGGCHTMVQAMLEPAKDSTAETATGDVSLKLEKVEEATNATSSKEMVSKVLPPLQNAPSLNGYGESVMKNNENSEIDQDTEMLKEESPVAKIIDPSLEPINALANGHNCIRESREEETDSKGSGNISPVLAELNGDLTNGGGELHISDEDVFSKYNLRDAGDLGNEITSHMADVKEKSDLPETPAILEVGEDDIKDKNQEAISDRRCSTDTTPILTVTGTDGVAVDSQDGSVSVGGENKTASFKKSTTSMEIRGEGRISKFLNAFRRKKLSEESVSVNMNPAWTGVERRISSENNMANGKNSSQIKIGSSQIHKSKACAIL